MTDFQSAFDTNTSGINTTLTTQLSSVQQWANVPGSLVKASSSQAGYLWGFNSINLVWVCQQPCTGQWTKVDLSSLTPVTPAQSIGTMSGSWIGGTRPIATVDKDNTGNPVYIIQDGTFVKMVNSAGISKNYAGSMNTYSSNNWNTYTTTPAGTYVVSLSPPPTAPTPPAILDIVTDETNVYLLYSIGSTTYVATKTANNQTDWSMTTVSNPTFSPINIFSTHTYLWLQTASNQKVKIPKPINMTNTMPIADTSVKITSSSSTALYGVDGTGKAMKSDETLQTGWAPVAGLAGMPVKTLVGDLDQRGLFFIDNNSRVSECIGDCSTNKTTLVNTQGYLPLYMTADPSTKQLWMTSSTTGSVGNIFNRVANPDYSSILNTVTPLDQNRDKVVGDVKDEYNKQTQVMTVNKQIGDFHDLFAQIFGDATKATQETNLQISKVESDVAGKQVQLRQITNIEPIIQKLVVTLASAALVYAIFSFLGWIVHAIVLVVIGVGIYLSLNNDISLSSLWARLP
jgi:hypothetical protein